jgi:hypothetical protein
MAVKLLPRPDMTGMLVGALAQQSVGDHERPCWDAG